MSNWLEKVKSYCPLFGRNKANLLQKEISSNAAKYIKVSKKAPANIVKRNEMRVSEVWGLTWNDIDLDNKIINLNR